MRNRSFFVQVKNHLSVVCRKFTKRPVSLFNSAKIVKDFCQVAVAV
jgi:hypothetical protein